MIPRLLAFLLIIGLSLSGVRGAVGQTLAPPYPGELPSNTVSQPTFIPNPISASSSVTLGQPGLSYRYVATFGATEEAYPADSAHLNRPNGLFIDANDNVYIVEELGSRMLKFDSTGANTLTLGAAGLHFVSDYVFSFPKDVITDSTGNLWVLDNHRLTQFDSGGTFLQVFPDYSLGPWNSGSDNQHFNNPRGLALDSAGRMYVSDQYNHRVQVYEVISNTLIYSATIGETGVAGSDNNHFSEPAQIVIDSADNLYVSDLLNFRVQKCSFSGGWTCATFHGTGSAGGGANELNFAYGLGRDVSDNIYITDGFNGRVKRCTSGGVCADFATGILWPADAAVDSDSNVYVSDFDSFIVRKYNGAGVAQPNFAGTSGVPYVTDTVRLNSPWGLATTPTGDVYVAENRGHRVVKLNAQGVQQWQVGQAGVYGSDNTHFGAFWAGVEGSLAVDGASRLYVPDTGNHRIQVFDSNGVYFQSFGSYGTGDLEFDCPAGVAIHPVNGDRVVVDKCNQRVQVFTSNWAYKATLGETDVAGADNAHFDSPWGAAVDASGAVYVADSNNHRVQKCLVSGSGGTCTTFVGETGVFAGDFGHLHPLAVAVDSAGRVYVADEWNNRVLVYDATGAFLTSIAGQWGVRSGELRAPSGVAVDGAGNVYVTDRENHRIQKFAPGVPGWQPSNLNGFGSPQNNSVWTLGTFNGQLYAGVSVDPATGTGLGVWRTMDGVQWSAVITDGWNDPNNYPGAFAVFNNALFFGIGNSTTGAGVFTTTDGINWTQVITGGFDSPTNQEIMHATAFNNHIYAATLNSTSGSQVWRSANGLNWTRVVTDNFGFGPTNNSWWTFEAFDGQLYAGSGSSGGGLLHRTSDGVNWTPVTTAGFGDVNNVSVTALADFNGQLYAATRNINAGAQIWRSSTGNPGTWTLAASGGLGNPDYGRAYGLIVADNALFFVATFRGSLERGDQVWRSSDGVNWTLVADDGWGDSNNIFSDYSDKGAAVFNNQLYIGSSNSVSGGEIWQYVGFPLYLPLVQR